MWPQIIILFLVVFSLGVGAANHGNIKSERVNFWTNLVCGLIGQGLLFWGGFYDKLIK